MVVAAKHGSRPYRVHIDPCDDGAEIVSSVRDRFRQDLYRRYDLENLLVTKT